MEKLFTPRKVAPTSDNKYWIQSSKSGLNECILIRNNSALPNCVGYAWGRFYELIGSKPKLSKNNAEAWYGYNDGYSRGQTPKLGAVICWSKGLVGNGDDGAGHVAIVEEIKADGTIVTSNSNYMGTLFFLQSYKYPYSLGKGYTFQGFIYPPIDFVSILHLGTPVQKDVNIDQIEIFVDDLRCRNTPDNSKEDNILGYITKGIYNILETKISGSYTWYKVESDKWIAHSENWSKIYPKTTLEELKKTIHDLEQQIISKNTTIDNLQKDISSFKKIEAYIKE